jgi:hypothetical protein
MKMFFDHRVRITVCADVVEVRRRIFGEEIPAAVVGDEPGVGCENRSLGLGLEGIESGGEDEVMVG